MTSYTDLSGVFQVQKALLNDISTQLSNTKNVTVNTNLYDQVQKMQADLDNYNNSFVQANESSNQVLDRQDNVQQLLDEEYNRLAMKQMNIDNALEGKRRGAFLNDNYRQRYAHYTKIVIIFVCTLIIIYMVNSSRAIIPIPNYLVDLIMLVIILVAAMMCYYTYHTILVRDKIYFDELNLPPPSTDLSNNTINATTDISYNTFSIPAFGLCVDSDCCNIGTVWDPTSFSCVATTDMSGGVVLGLNNGTANSTTTGGANVSYNTAIGGGTIIQPFTTLDQAYIGGDVKKIIETEQVKSQPNDANEFNVYTVYN